MKIVYDCICKQNILKSWKIVLANRVEVSHPRSPIPIAIYVTLSSTHARIILLICVVHIRPLERRSPNPSLPLSIHQPNHRSSQVNHPTRISYMNTRWSRKASGVKSVNEHLTPPPCTYSITRFNIVYKSSSVCSVKRSLKRSKDSSGISRKLIHRRLVSASFGVGGEVWRSFSPLVLVETLKCKLCNATYKHRPDFLHHVQSVHKLHSSSSHACSLCPAQFDTNSELVDHLTYTHKVTANHPRHPSFNALFTCNFCSLKLSSRFELNHHLLHEHDDERQDSKSDEHPNDKKSSKNTTTLGQWLEKKPDDESDVEISWLWWQIVRSFFLGNFSSSEVPCPRCDLTFSNESQLCEHQKHAHPSPPPVSSAPPSFKCSYCHTSFTSRTQLDRHSRIHIAASGNNLKCNICDRLFTSIDILSEHKLSHCKATTSNICSYCHQTLHNEADYTRHLYEHNHQSKSKTKLFTGHQDTTPLTIACIVCKQSLINEREIDLHAKFHLTSPLNKTLPTRPVDSSPLTVTCHGCRRSSTTNREFFIELPSFTVHCFQCLAKGLDPSGKRVRSVTFHSHAFITADSHPVSEINGTSNSLSCPKCRTDVQFDSIKTYQQHFASVHLTSNVTEEYHWYVAPPAPLLLLDCISLSSLKCNKIVMLREHIYQHLSVQSSTSSGFLIDSVPPTRCPSPPRVHYCYLCRTNFDTAIKMHIHLIEHQYPNHDYQCNLCDNVRFDDASQLYHHMVQHGSKTRLYPCRECDVFFMFSMHLINHQHSHTDETVLTSSSPSASKSNGSTKGLRLTTKSKSVLSHDDHKRSHDEDDATCKPMLTRSSSKGTNRSVTVN